MLIRANPAKAVPAVLDLLADTVKTSEDYSLNEKINRMKGQFPAVMKWEEKLLDQCSELYRYHRQFDGPSVSSHSQLLKDIGPNINQMETLLDQLCATPEYNSTDTATRKLTPQHQNGFRELSELEKKIIKEEAMDSTVKILRVSYDRLDRLDLKMCLLFLAIFPENAVLKKRLIIYWWIGEGLIATEEDGENIFDELLKLEFIIPYGNGECPLVNKCQIHPWIRYMLMAVGAEEQLLRFDKGIPCFDPTSASSRRLCLIGNRKMLLTDNDPRNETLRTIFNVSESSVRLESKWFAKMKKLVVLQLGRWQVSPFHRIEVQSQVLLRGLRAKKHLKYLSLRGISRITSIPPSIVELVSLEILDLKDCRNLETLPADISSLWKLTHLDVSECYLLENMPKGLDKLSNLQVLKGFIIGNSEKTPCTVGDLKRLEKLKRLSIHIGSEALIQHGELDKLKDLESVRCLKISWGVSQTKKNQVAKEPLSFPSSLEKLVLECMPQAGMPDWLNPSKLGRLEELYIKGGELRSLGRGDSRWKVKYLRLKYMENLQDYTAPELKIIFPSLMYVQKIRNATK